MKRVLIIYNVIATLGVIQNTVGLFLVSVFVFYLCIPGQEEALRCGAREPGEAPEADY